MNATVEKGDSGLKAAVNDALEELDPFQHLTRLDYPRNAGTHGEWDAAIYVYRYLRGLGLAPGMMAFPLYPFTRKLGSLPLPAFVFSWVMLGYLDAFMFLEQGPLQTVFFLVIFSAPFVLGFMLARMDLILKYLLGKRKKIFDKLGVSVHADESIFMKSRLPLLSYPGENCPGAEGINVFAHIHPPGWDGEGNHSNLVKPCRHVLFTAHLDSVSTLVPPWRASRYLLSFLVFLVAHLLILLGNFVMFILSADSRSLVDETISSGLALPLLPSGVILVVLSFMVSRGLFSRGDSSRGVVDDATGVAILLEIAKFLVKNPVDGYEFTLGFFGAEELGMIGSTAFLSTMQATRQGKQVPNLEPGDQPPVQVKIGGKSRDELGGENADHEWRLPDLVISVDMIGEVPPLNLTSRTGILGGLIMDMDFIETMKEISGKIGVSLKSCRKPYPGSDFAPFALLEKVPAAQVGGKSRVFHTPLDACEAVNPDTVRDALRLLVGYCMSLGTPRVSFP